jgi:(S)-2-hydroxy-acid oxidase
MCEKKVLGTVAEYETYALRHLNKNIRDYYASGANDMITMRENRDAFRRLRITPGVLQSIDSIDTETSVLGATVRTPILIAPTAFHEMAHPGGETSTARAAQRAGSLMCLSSLSTQSLERVREAAGAAPCWFQLYLFKDRAVVLDLLRRAEAAGYQAVALTVDTPRLGRREPDVKNRFSLPAPCELCRKHYFWQLTSIYRRFGTHVLLCRAYR